MARGALRAAAAGPWGDRTQCHLYADPDTQGRPSGNARVTRLVHGASRGRTLVNLFIAKAIGRGSTELAAFDAALIGAGVANFNVIP